MYGAKDHWNLGPSLLLLRTQDQATSVEVTYDEQDDPFILDTLVPPGSK